MSLLPSLFCAFGQLSYANGGDCVGKKAWNSSPQWRNGEGRRVRKKKEQTDGEREPRQEWADAQSFKIPGILG